MERPKWKVIMKEKWTDLSIPYTASIDTMSSTTSTTGPRVAIIVGSQRERRAGLQIAEFVQETLRENQSPADLAIVDLAAWNLPLYNEPGIPAGIFSAEDYHHDHTRRWSKEIASYQAFIFVTPQYNWGYPASLKNALDYLYNEWKEKPAMIVSYGGHGGDKAAAQLKQVCQGLRMFPLDSPVYLTWPNKEFVAKVNNGEELNISRRSAEGWSGLFTERRGEIQERFEELLSKM